MAKKEQKKVSKAEQRDRREASRRYYRRNKKKAKIAIYKSNARSFIQLYAPPKECRYLIKLCKDRINKSE